MLYITTIIVQYWLLPIMHYYGKDDVKTQYSIRALVLRIVVDHGEFATQMVSLHCTATCFIEGTAAIPFCVGRRALQDWLQQRSKWGDPIAKWSCVFGEHLRRAYHGMEWSYRIATVMQVYTVLLHCYCTYCTYLRTYKLYACDIYVIYAK